MQSEAIESEDQFADESRGGISYSPGFARHVGPIEFFVRARMLEREIVERLGGHGKAGEMHENAALHENGALLAIKRSGWVLGVQLSHATKMPVFAVAEMASIPEKYGRIIIVDTVCWTGRSIRRALSALGRAGRDYKRPGYANAAAAVLFAKEKLNPPLNDGFIALEETNVIPKFFFQKGFRLDFANEQRYLDIALNKWSEPLGE